jgi:hypothetical protein
MRTSRQNPARKFYFPPVSPKGKLTSALLYVNAWVPSIEFPISVVEQMLRKVINGLT